MAFAQSISANASIAGKNSNTIRTSKKGRVMEPIKVWPFYSAPEEYQKLSSHGGDEDWVAFIPTATFEMTSQPIWMEDGTAFGCCEVSKHPVDGGIVFIGAHA